VTGEFPDIICLVLFFNQGDAIFHGRKGASEDSDCTHLGVCQAAGVKVAGCHIGLELVTPICVSTRCDAGIEKPTPRFGVRNVAIRLPNLCLIVSVTDSDSWVDVSFELPSARVFDGWLKVRALRPVSVHKKVCCQRHILQLRISCFP
jgi:hypothetical protein